MLGPFDYGIITLEESAKLIEFIERHYGRRDYHKMQTDGILNVYTALRSLVDKCTHYYSELDGFEFL